MLRADITKPDITGRLHQRLRELLPEATEEQVSQLIEVATEFGRDLARKRHEELWESEGRALPTTFRRCSECLEYVLVKWYPDPNLITDPVCSEHK